MYFGHLLHPFLHPFLHQFLMVGCFAALFLATLWTMRRLQRAQVLRLVGGLMRQGLPLESTLARIAMRSPGAPEARFGGRLSLRLAGGESLPDALKALRVLDPGQAAALRLAERHGASQGVLEALAGNALPGESKILGVLLMALYPLLVGLLLFGASFFILIFIAPKYEQMMKEMGLAAPEHWIWVVAFSANAALLVWGLLVFTLLIEPLGGRLWRPVPWLGAHLHMQAQARLARVFGLALGAGATLEECVRELAASRAGGFLAGSLRKVGLALERGTAPTEAFHTHGRWRPEFLWALESAAQGAPPGLVFAEVAQVLEDKSQRRYQALYRFGTFLAVLISAGGVGTFAVSVFHSLSLIAEGLLSW